MFFVYVLQSNTHGTYYVGSTKNIKTRLHEHNSGKCRYTKGRKPWVLVHSEEFATITEARKREVFLKTGNGREYLKGILSN